MSFSEPLWITLGLILLLLFFIFKKRSLFLPWSHLPKIIFSRNFKFFLVHGSYFLGCGSLILALMGPITPLGGQREIHKGLSMVLVLDTSGSMKAMDLLWEGKRQDRLTVAKKILKNFIEKRSQDRLGLVFFGETPLVGAPLTLDHRVIHLALKRASVGMVGESTALGDALGIAAQRLKDLKDPSKIIVLLTDGVNNSGKLSPQHVAQACKTLGIKVYTIGLGSQGPVPMETPLGIQHVTMDLDEETLKFIAKTTDGFYFRAQTSEDLKHIYERIHTLEKTDQEGLVFRKFQDHFPFWIKLGLCFFLCYIVLQLTPLGKIP